ncbi:hypothetical protein ISN45_Aa07g001520 [Arabidopsis thaliana x Arabidopsis arenosa]|uniref:Transmembrane protein n=1 Tax=Arabidopsis thaliana x Arabidopsis arenosa TaxID=1240361 RepID=A0A8T1Y0D8_9BRAS|nr:hypothetical protein ISN45_Aa07g001520 [Arabidopsis thaliana x Arabidopsis arenosa]
MYKEVFWLVTLIFLLFSGSSNTALARMEYETPNTKEGIWDEKLIRGSKIETPGSSSRRAPDPPINPKP